MSFAVEVGGMTCGGCVTALRRALTREGVADATVELGVVCLPDDRDRDLVFAAIEKAGFTVASGDRPTRET